MNHPANGYTIMSKPKTRKGQFAPRALWMLRARLSLGVHPETGKPWTQAQLGDVLGWSYTTVSGYERARTDDDVPVDAMWAVHGFTGYDLPDGFHSAQPPQE